MNERIKAIIAALNIKKAEFAKRLNLSQPFVSELCSAAKSPSDRTISDICREFNVNENWLRTGDGQMFIQVSRDEEIAAFIGDVLSGETGDFRRRLISVLERLDTDQWELLEHIAEELAQIEKEGAEQ